MSNMRNDKKIKRLIARYGLAGYGLYNIVVESITENITTENPIPDLEETCADLADFYNGDTTRINETMSFMINNDLFELDEITGRVLCDKIYKFLQSSQTRSMEIKRLIKNYTVLQNSGHLLMSQTVPDEEPHSNGDIVDDIGDNTAVSQTVSDGLILSQQEQNRTEQNRTEQNRREQKETPIISQGRYKREPTNIDNMIEYWNSKPLPEFRLLSTNIPTLPQIIDACSHYKDEEIQSAIDNYADMLTHANDYAYLPRYPTVASFLEKGIHAFFNGANPRETFKQIKKPGKPEAPRVPDYVPDVPQQEALPEETPVDFRKLIKKVGKAPAEGDDDE